VINMRYYFLFLCLVSCISCNSEFVSSEVKDSYDQVMKIHDDIMPEVSTIRRLKKRVGRIDDNSSTKSELIHQLEAANEGMMEWMHQFDLDKKATEQQQIEYLLLEKKRVTKVSNDMVNAMQSANEYLNNKDQ